MANRVSRRTVILAAIESLYGTLATLTGAANAMLVSNLTINPLNAQNVSRDLIRPFFGGSEQLVGTRYVECSFDIELVGAGAGLALPCGPLLLACGMAETLTAGIRSDYTLVSDAITSVSIEWYDDGVVHRLLGARGNVELDLVSGNRPVFKFSFTGLVGTVAAASNPTPVYTAFKTPQVVTDANTADLFLGCTHSTTGAPALAGGTSFPSQGLSLNLGNSVNHIPLIGGESVEITQRETTGSCQLDLTAADEVTAFAAVNAATLTSVGIVHGTVVGQRTLVFMPFVQRINPSKVDLQGKRLIGYDLRVIPSAGNDEIRIVTGF